MKTTQLMMAVITVSLISGIQAEDRKKERPERSIPPGILKQFDKDGDGKLNEEERKAAREARDEKVKARKEEMLKKFDANGDGKLDEEERKKMHEEMRKKALERFDKDGDGQLSEEEKKEMRKEMGDRPRPHGRKGGEGKKRVDDSEESDEAPRVLGE